MPTDQIFTPTEGYGALRYVSASFPADSLDGTRISVQSSRSQLVVVSVNRDRLGVTFDLPTAVARALAAELIASADACDEFERAERDPAA